MKSHDCYNCAKLCHHKKEYGSRPLPRPGGPEPFCWIDGACLWIWDEEIYEKNL